MSEQELISTVSRLRRRLRGHAQLFEDPASYVDGVEDALELVERAVTGEDVEAGLLDLDDDLERTA
jgi:hypothetical protein